LTSAGRRLKKSFSDISHDRRKIQGNSFDQEVQAPLETSKIFFGFLGPIYFMKIHEVIRIQ
jgi:hypothetical protein